MRIERRKEKREWNSVIYVSISIDAMTHLMKWKGKYTFEDEEVTDDGEIIASMFYWKEKEIQRKKKRRKKRMK